MGESFLLARLIADQLSVAPIDTSVPNWQQYLAGSVEAAFGVDLARVTTAGFTVPNGIDSASLARTMLTALTWGLGAGLPEDEWLAVARALVDSPLDADQVSWVLDQLGRYVVQDGEAGVAVYRIAHQSLADYLRPTYHPTASQPFDPTAAVVWSALAARYERLLRDGHLLDELTYLRRYGSRHAVAAGPDGVGRLRALSDLDRGLRPYVAEADLALAAILAEWGRYRDALSLAQEAATLCRELAAANPVHLPGLASALNNLSVYYRQLGRPEDALAPTQEAVTLCRNLVSTSDADLSGLAIALTNLGIGYGQLGRPQDALAHSEEAVTIDRRLAAANPAHLSTLAGALGNLGTCYRELGRFHDAVAVGQEAVDLLRRLVRTGSAYLPELAMALNNVGIGYGALGLPEDALAPTEEAVTLYRGLAQANPAHLPRLAMALSNLGIRYSELGRDHDAFAVTDEAVTRYRELVDTDPAELPAFTSALINLGKRCRALGRLDEACALTEEAVALRRDLAATNPAHVPYLATALSNLGAYYGQLGRLDDALASSEEAVALRRDLAGANPADLLELAKSLNNLGNRYSELGRHQEALAVTEEAVNLYRELPSGNAAEESHLASALINLGKHYSSLDRPGDALSVTQDAVALYRELAAANPAHRPDLAMALNNLGKPSAQLNRTHEALAPAEEAVAIYRDLAAVNPAYMPNLAFALINLGNCYAELGRSALAPTEEAVTIYREQVSANSVQRAALANALTSLGMQYGQMNRRDDALTATREAVALYRELATNPAHLPNLAMALNNLDRLLVTAGDVDGADFLWSEVLDSQPVAQRQAWLLLYRSRAAGPGDPRVVAWLAEAATAAAPDRALLAAAHDTARAYRSADARNWDPAWIDATGEPIPLWFSVDPALLATARAWVDTPTYAAERDHLAVHTELLDPTADTAIDEALLQVPEQEATRYQSLRAIAQAEGIDIAYRPFLDAELAQRFSDAPPDQQQRMLRTEHDQLLDDTARSWLADAAEHEASPDAIRADALVTLAAHDTAGSTLDAVFTALGQPELFREVLNNIARDPDTAAALLAPASTVAFTAADTAESAGVALLYNAAAAAVIGDTERAAQLIQDAATTAPGQRPAWITLLANLGATTPAVLNLIPHLTEGLSR